MKKCLIIPAAVLFLIFFVLPVTAKERIAVVTIRFETTAPLKAKKLRFWMPYPMSDEYQDITEVNVSGNYLKTGIYREPVFGNNILYAEWNTPINEIQFRYSYKVKRRERLSKNFKNNGVTFIADEYLKYTDLNRFGSAKLKIVNYANMITKDKIGALDKARAVYDWIINNMRRDPEVKGCGFGDVESLLESKGGKCADIHSVFVALARAAGVPAREVFGIRIPKGKEGDMTKAQHCWAEFYLPGNGWIAADPADVRKHILEKKLSLKEASDIRAYYFGSVDESRVAFGTGDNIMLNPSQSGKALNYFMYPYAELDGKALGEDLYGFNMGYKIYFKEDIPGK
ncbi:MAG: hypothetical protein A2W19_04400 [Spirochaetes bacterium RBG_16_49_21]|nr:MAG: hypothetical protein A2W19_04400 [Spirochaetes bacterium RBG_16_49_21]